MGFFHTIQNKKGFTFVEMLVAAAVIGILATTVYMNGGESRKKARDTQRMNDVQQIALALRMYRELNSVNPVYANGIVIGEGGVLDDATTGLGPYLTVIPQDPQGSAGTTYEYIYDSDYTCGGTSRVVLYAKTMEQAGHGNWASVCGTYSGGTSASTYGMIIK